MQYEKPEVAVLTSSIKAIQGMPKFSHTSDATGHTPGDFVTVSAYEADE